MEVLQISHSALLYELQSFNFGPNRTKVESVLFISNFALYNLLPYYIFILSLCDLHNIESDICISLGMLLQLFSKITFVITSFILH